MPARRNISSGAPWEDIVGYSRAVVIGDRIVVSGCTGIDPDGGIAPDIELQARQAIENIAAALAEADATLADVVRTRIYVTDIDRWQDVATAHAAAFGTVRPAATMVEVSRLIDPALLVEIEAEAVRAPD
mgnify:CR=1 FL=1